MQGFAFDDCIGAESCADLRSEFDVLPRANGDGRAARRLAARSEPAEEKELPPPIQRNPLWVMRKYSTGDGRLIIREERIQQQEYFRAYRYDGRLLLNLLSPDGEEVSNRTAIGDAAGASEFFRYNGIGMTPCAGFAAVAVLGPPLRI